MYICIYICGGIHRFHPTLNPHGSCYKFLRQFPPVRWFNHMKSHLFDGQAICAMVQAQGRWSSHNW